MLDIPEAATLEAVNDVEPDQYPRMATVHRHRDPPRIVDLDARVREALDAITGLEDLPAGAEIGVTAGSRGITDAPAVIESIVAVLRDREFDPFVFPAMGSHGGASAAGQREMVETLGVTEERLDCEIRSSMEVERVATDDEGRPVFASETALGADGVVLANRIKAHTDFEGDIESGLCKMLVIGVGKQRGANAAHNAALERSFRSVLPEWASILIEEVPILGGIGLIENANERLAELDGVPADEIVTREPALLERADELMPTLPVDDLDLLVLDEIGKNISGTGMDTNVVGRMMLATEPEYDAPDITRIHVRSLTPEAHGNANGIGLADFAHRSAVEGIDLRDTYLNAITGAQPERGKLPVVVPTDRVALAFTYSATSVVDPADLRIAAICNTLEPDELVVSEPVADDLADRPDIEVGELRALAFDADGDLDLDPPWSRC